MWEEIVYGEESFDHSHCEVRALSPCMEELQMCSVCRCAVKSHMDFFQIHREFRHFHHTNCCWFWWLLRFLQLLLTQSNPSPGAVCIELCPQKLLCIGVIDIATLIFSEL